MAIYAYRCPTHGILNVEFPLGKAPASVACEDGIAVRYFGPDALPQIAAMDPFRAYDLSPRKEAAQVEQQRYVVAPRDRFEARRQERELGRTYVGDDTSGMTKNAQKAVELYRDRKRAGERV